MKFHKVPSFLLATLAVSSLIATPSYALLKQDKIVGDEKCDFQMYPVDRTPSPDTVKITIENLRENGAVLDKSPSILSIEVEEFPLWFKNDASNEKKQLRQNRDGQNLTIWIDDNPTPLYIKRSDKSNTLTETEPNLENTYQVKLPTLSPGEHLIRIIPTKSWGEGLKNGYVARHFFVKSKTPNRINNSLSKPYVTFNAPMGKYSNEQPVLLDFHVSNCELGDDAYKIKVIIDGTRSEMIKQDHPFFIRGLSSGSHTIELQLICPAGKVVQPLFGKELKRSFKVGTNEGK